MPATLIAERVGWTGSISWFRDNVRRLRPEHRPVDQSDRLIWLPGDAGPESKAVVERRHGSFETAPIPARVVVPPNDTTLSSADPAGRDYYVRVDNNHYAVVPEVIGRIVDVHADLSRVEVRLDGRLVAIHSRIWTRRQIVIDPVEVAAAKVLHQRFVEPSRPVEPDALMRDLAD